MSTYIDTFIFWYTMAMAFVTRWTIFIICTILYNASLSDALSFSFQYISALLMTFTFDVFPFPTWIALIYTDTLQIVSETSGLLVEKKFRSYTYILENVWVHQYYLFATLRRPEEACRFCLIFFFFSPDFFFFNLKPVFCSLDFFFFKLESVFK